MNNAFISNYFKVNRGVRQGDPLSPFLFILALRVLACSIRQDENIQGIKTGNKEVKLAIYADDMTCFLKGNPCYEYLLCKLAHLASLSGLNINTGKTEFFLFGFGKKLETFPYELKKSLKILGVHFSYNELSRKIENFEEILKSIKKTLNMWKRRGLTIIGKTQIVKSFAIPKFMSKAAVIFFSNDLVKEVNKELYHFIWN